MTRAWMTTMVLATGCTLGGDDPYDGGQFGEEGGAHCAVVGSTPLALDAVSALGFAPQDLLALAEGTHASTLTWHQAGGTTGVTVEVIYDGGGAELLDYELVSDEPGGPEPAIEIACPDVVEVAVDFAVHTDDGQLAEVWSGALAGASAAEATARIDLDAPGGSFDAWDHVPADNDYDALSAWLELIFDAQGSWGTIHGQGEGGDRSDPDGAVWAENIEMGSWSPGAEE